MSDEDEPEEPGVELGDPVSVEGAPLARISSRLTWPLQQSEVRRREGESTIRTPEGPRELADILEEIEVAYFESRQEFETSIREVVGTGPVPTE